MLLSHEVTEGTFTVLYPFDLVHLTGRKDSPGKHWHYILCWILQVLYMLTLLQIKLLEMLGLN